MGSCHGIAINQQATDGFGSPPLLQSRQDPILVKMTVKPALRVGGRTHRAQQASCLLSGTHAMVSRAKLEDRRMIRKKKKTGLPGKLD